MDLPPGFTMASDVGKVYKLNKTLYGLKQSPRAWFGKFSQSFDTPIEQNHKLGDDRVDQVPTNNERYQRLVGR
jgi:hypothetical protein